MRIANALNEHLRNAQSIGLYRGEVRKAAKGRAELGASQLREVVNSAKVHREVRDHGTIGQVAAEFEAVTAFDDGEVIATLAAFLHSLNERERLAPKERESWNVDGDIAAARRRRKVVQQPAARKFVTRFIDLVAAQNPCILHADAAIVVVLC